MRLSIYLLSATVAFFCLAGIAQAEEPAVATPAVDAGLSGAVDFLPAPEFLNAPSDSAKNPGTESACSASTTCPGSVRLGIAPYQLSCEGDYECYSVPGEYVYCDGFGTLCFP
ncbi:MAG: hypothetical protein SX243_19550 [Acidobacteriota bacterium]|nr:hypothetical protein [Acidobacteriota bacterium]